MSVSPSTVKSLFVHYQTDISDDGILIKKARFASVEAPIDDSSSSSSSGLTKTLLTDPLLPLPSFVGTASLTGLALTHLTSLPQLYGKPAPQSTHLTSTEGGAKTEAEHPSLTSMEEFAKKIKALEAQPFETRMDALNAMAKPVLNKTGITLGLGFQVRIKESPSGTSPVVVQFFIRKGSYESDIVTESSFPVKKRAKEYYYFEVYEIIGTHSTQDESLKLLKIRLSPFNGEIVNIYNGINVSGKDVFALIRVLTPLFRGIETMYLFDDAKKKFAHLKLKSGDVLFVWIKVAAICHPLLQTPYEEHLGVVPAKIHNWILKEVDYGSVELSQSAPEEEYRPALRYFSTIKMRSIYLFMKKYPGVAGRADRIGKTVFIDFEFGTTEHTLAVIYGQLLIKSRGEFTVGLAKRKPKLIELDSAKRNLAIFHNMFFIPWEIDSKAKACEEEAIYLKHLTVLSRTRVFQFLT